MRKLDKKLNIYNANKLAEERYLNEDWKTNLAAGLATAGGVAGAQAQNNKTIAPQQQGKEIQHSLTKTNANVANPYGVEDDSMIHPRTIPIVGIQTGVTVGPKGIPAVYVYHNHKPGHPNFNPETDREIVYVSNLDNLRKTNEYQEYMRKLNKGRDIAIAGDID